MSSFYCYLLFTANQRQTYIGATVDPNRRLRQHNQELAGGARRTKGFVWQRALYIGGFPDWNATLQFEWSWKRHGRGKPGLAGKLDALLNLLHSEKSTSTATPFRYWPSKITIHPEPSSVQIMGKIECFLRLLAECGRTITDLPPFFSFQTFPSFPNLPKMSILSAPVDIAALALQLEELSTNFAQLKARVDAALAASAAAPKTKKPRKSKSDSVPTTPEAKNEIIPDAPKKARKPRTKKVAVEPMTSLESATDGPATEAPATDASATEAKKAKKVKEPKEPKEKKPKATCPVGAEGVLRFNKSAGDAPLKELSNFFTAELSIDGQTYRTAEAYLQSEKYATTDAEYAQKIRDQKNSALLRGMGKSKAHTARADWDSVRLDVMRKGLEAKFAAPALSAVLLGTGTATLELESVDDAFWGIGADGKGENWTGKLLMELRTKLSA